METYFILEDNMPRLQKKLKRIESKCIQYGCSFEFKEIGEEVRSIKYDESGEILLAKYIKVQAEGVAKIPNWEFVAQSLEAAQKDGLKSVSAYMDSLHA